MAKLTSSEIVLHLQGKTIATEIKLNLEPRQLQAALVGIAVASDKEGLKKELDDLVRELFPKAATGTNQAEWEAFLKGQPDDARRVMVEIVLMEDELGSTRLNEDILVSHMSEKYKMDPAEIRKTLGNLLKSGILYNPIPGVVRRTDAEGP